MEEKGRERVWREGRGREGERERKREGGERESEKERERGEREGEHNALVRVSRMHNL